MFYINQSLERGNHLEISSYQSISIQDNTKRDGEIYFDKKIKKSDENRTYK